MAACSVIRCGEPFGPTANLSRHRWPDRRRASCL